MRTTIGHRCAWTWAQFTKCYTSLAPRRGREKWQLPANATLNITVCFPSRISVGGCDSEHFKLYSDSMYFKNSQNDIYCKKFKSNKIIWFKLMFLCIFKNAMSWHEVGERTILFSFKTHTFYINMVQWLTHGLPVRCAVSLSFLSRLTRCSSNSLNSYIKSVNTVLFNLQNYFQKASPPMRGHQMRFKVHILSQPAFHREHRWTRGALHA